MISSNQAYPGWRIAVKVVPAMLAETLKAGGKTYELRNGIALIRIEEDTALSFAAVIDGMTTLVTATVQITAARLPATPANLPPLSVIELEVSAEIAVKWIAVHGSDIVPGAFDEDVVLMMDEVGNWLSNGYRFVIRLAAEE